MQEKVAEEMIRMAQSMKHNSMRSQNIINADKTVSVYFKSSPEKTLS